MYTNNVEVRVRYADTDQMGFVYYGTYARYFEIARVESMRNLGIVYKDMEEKGILMPVLDMHIKYIKPAHYDEILTIKLTIPEQPGVRIKFEYEVNNEAGILLVTGSTQLVFLDVDTAKPVEIPDYFSEVLIRHFN